MHKLAQEQESTFIVYSLAPLDYNFDKKGVGAWVVPPKGDIFFNLLPIETIHEVLLHYSFMVDGFPFYQQRGFKRQLSLSVLKILIKFTMICQVYIPHNVWHFGKHYEVVFSNG